MKKTVSYLLVRVGGLVLVVVCLFLAYFMSTGGLGLPMKWEIPPGYKGWVILRSGDPSCRPYERRGFWLVVQVANDGKACTSDPRDTKWRFQYYVYVHPDGSTTGVDEVAGEHAHYEGTTKVDEITGLAKHYASSDKVVDA